MFEKCLTIKNSNQLFNHLVAHVGPGWRLNGSNLSIPMSVRPAAVKTGSVAGDSSENPNLMMLRYLENLKRTIVKKL